MPRIDDETKQQRLERIALLLMRNARGLTESEIAEEIGMQRRSVNTYLHELEFQGKAFKDGMYWFPLTLKESRLRPFDLSPEEAVTLYLGARLLSKQQDKRNEPAETALLKLASALKADAGVGAEIEQAARELAQRPTKKEYQPIFRDVVRGYIYRKKVEIVYRPLHGKPFPTLFCTYLLEPSPIGFTTYLIGHSSVPNALRAYKLERIESIRLTRESYSVPPDFPGLEILRNSWSIVMGETTIRVVLRFSPRVKKRVLETRWHPSQKTSDDTAEPGGLLWEVQVADTLDLLPWIRSWGADVEVLEPKELRESLEEEVRKLARVYGVGKANPEDELMAHVRKRDRKEQKLVTHLVEAAQFAKRFASKVGLPEIGKILGLLHDLGKASQEYQNYLRTYEGLISPDEDGYSQAKRGEIDHSTAGAQLIYEKLASRGQDGKILAQFLALAIASHHSGLIDCLKPDGFNEFERRINKDDNSTHFTEAKSKLPSIEKQMDEVLTQPLENNFRQKLMDMKDADRDATLPFKHGLLARFLLSCLLDADRLSTGDFEDPGNIAIRNYGKYIPWDTLIDRLETHFAIFDQETASMEPGRARDVNQLRAQVAQACLEASTKPKGIYQLTVPTGGGKTLASLRFALHHARAHKMDRVFYIVPYITIIDQNAKDVRDVLKDVDEKDQPLDQIVLEHHSNYVPPDDTRQRHNLLSENWDAPIVFTTQVQFLEALFGSGTRDARRMHQLANSVIILDEVQTVPIKIVHMLNAALRFLTHDCGSTVVLCTATQPPLDDLPENPYRALTIRSEQKIIQNETELFKNLKRVEVHDVRRPEGWSNAEIAELAEHALQEKGSVLIVANTRDAAHKLYLEIKGRLREVEIYHLSTNMCPAHRLDVLEQKVKANLKDNKPVICVSTQLIEAGVNVDFGAVIRMLAGLDSIAQSAGRCNRHGMRDGLGSVWVVNPQDEHLDRLEDIKIGRGHAQRVLDDFRDSPETFGNDRIGLEAMATYYRYYYGSRKEELDYPVSAGSSVGRNDSLFSLLSQNKLSIDAYKSVHHSAPDMLLRQSFRTANEEFRVIDSPTRGVIVPYKDGEQIISELCGAFWLEKQGKLLKQAQRYSVNLFAYQFDKLFKAGILKEVQPETGIYYLDEQYYSEEFGWSDAPVNGTQLHII